MNLQPLAVLLVVAVLFFWATGAHNRLLLLRKGVAQAGARLTDALAQRNSALLRLYGALLQPLAHESGALLALSAAQAEEDRAARSLVAQALDAAAARAWLTAHARLESCALRVMSLLEQQTELRQQEAVALPLLAWQEAQARLGLLRQAYNDAAEAYDVALRQFPTRLLVPAFRFKPAGRV